MMNIVALGLVLASLFTATVWSPPPSPSPQSGDSEVIVKGHRVVVVEYEKEGQGNTKVLISPQESSGVEFKDPANAAERPAVDHDDGKFAGPRELVCDAFGKCKHKIAHALGKTKEKVSETAHDVSDKAHDLEEQAKETVKEAFGKGKPAAEDASVGSKFSEKVSEKVKGGEEKTRKGPTVGESVGKAKDSMVQGISKGKNVAGDVVGTIKDTTAKAKDFDVVDSPKRIGEDIERNVTGKVEEGAEHVMEQAKETAENVQKMGLKSPNEIISKLQEVMYDVICYLLSPQKVDAAAGLIHMLGLSTGYGMCVWVTFASSYILGRYLPREQFGMIQSRIYPVYFRAMAYCLGAVFLGHVVCQRKVIMSSIMELCHCFSLLSALLMVLANMLYLEPKATKVSTPNSDKLCRNTMRIRWSTQNPFLFW